MSCLRQTGPLTEETLQAVGFEDGDVLQVAPDLQLAADRIVLSPGSKLSGEVDVDRFAALGTWKVL